MILHTNDIRFSHSYSSSWYNKPKKFVWSREINSDCNLMVFTKLETIDNFPKIKKKFVILCLSHIVKKKNFIMSLFSEAFKLLF